MALEIRHNRAEHTHENEQFRRIATSLKLLFEQKSWNGLLIGNPYNDHFSRFRADAILLYDYGLIIIDLKDYRGTIKLPPNDEEFQNTKWYSESDTDKQRIQIKAGARFINPFRQLKSYREAMYEVVRSNLYLRNNLDPSRMCIVNIFSGPITLHHQVPKSLPYYKIVQESEIGTFLYDFSSENTCDEESASALKVTFGASPWDEKIDVPVPSPSHTQERVIEINNDVKAELSNFLKEESGGILVLESMHAHERDDWMRYILSETVEFGIPQAEVWAHSSRISRKISNRTGIEIQSLFNTIYGGASSVVSEDNREEDQETEENNEEQLLEVIAIGADSIIDDSAVIILHEAHLINRSLYQSELLRFGSGRLLEDLLKFLSLDSNNRKLVCIGDPYSLSYGKYEDSALCLETLKELYSGNIKHYRQSLQLDRVEGAIGIRTALANNIKNKSFNSLSYPWHDESLSLVDQDGARAILKNWFSEPVLNEPQRSALIYSNKNARKINQWIKKVCLGNGAGLAKNDLLLINNNVNIPDPTGFGQPTRLFNGMYLLVQEKHQTEVFPIPIRQSKQPIQLSFTKVRASCLSVPNKPIADVWVLDNYFSSDDQLSKNEQIALRIFVREKIDEALKKYPFSNSFEYKQLRSDLVFLDLSGNEKDAIEKLIKLDSAASKEKVTTTQIARSLLSSYKKKYQKKLLSDISLSDPFVNAAFVSYGWALTVHKAVGSSFSQVLLNAYQGENRGVANSDYNRWLYSAVTASTQIAYVSNPQEVHPLIDCVFEDVDILYPTDGGSSKKLALSYSDYEVPPKFQKLFNSSLSENVIGAVCELSLLIEQYGYLLKFVQQSGDYITKAEYSIPDVSDTLRIVFNNNAAGVVSSIRIERSAGIVEAPVNEAIKQLFTLPKTVTAAGDIGMPSDFRSVVYKAWSDILKKEGYTLHIREMYNFQDVLEAINCDSKVKFRAYYNAKGFFTKISIIQTTEPQLGQSFHHWLLATKQD